MGVVSHVLFQSTYIVLVLKGFYHRLYYLQKWIQFHDDESLLASRRVQHHGKKRIAC
jgi:hypothetical protein